MGNKELLPFTSSLEHSFLTSAILRRMDWGILGVGPCILKLLKLKNTAPSDLFFLIFLRKGKQKELSAEEKLSRDQSFSS